MSFKDNDCLDNDIHEDAIIISVCAHAQTVEM